MKASIVFGAECSCGRKLTCIQTSAANYVLGDSVRRVWRVKPTIAELERARDHLNAEIAKLKR